ncbi:MAG: zinc ribbon domain-containing protein [Gammaproteobacteria bacterium]|nr:zinc ribbon domain-containing protein [Gammaproteobacteria bacterium]
MPVYDFVCPDCGPFEALLPSAERDQPQHCPQCAAPLQRRITAPRLQILSRAQRQAHETNERSAHAPRVHHGHACCSSGSCQHHARATQDGTPPLRAQQGVRRPWMISH